MVNVILQPRDVSRRFFICTIKLPSPSKKPAIYAQSNSLRFFERLPTVLPYAYKVYHEGFTVISQVFDRNYFLK